MVSFLASTMLHWIFWPTKPSQKLKQQAENININFSAWVIQLVYS